MAHYSSFEQRQMDAESGAQMDKRQKNRLRLRRHHEAMRDYFLTQVGFYRDRGEMAMADGYRAKAAEETEKLKAL